MAKTGSLSFVEVFLGFETVEAVRSIFSDRTEEILADLRVDVLPRAGYLRVDDETGNIVVSSEYLKTGDERYLYLDVIHELVHIKQFMQGKELFDRRYSYVDRPTEIEAYGAARKGGQENRDEEGGDTRLPEGGVGQRGRVPATPPRRGLRCGKERSVGRVASKPPSSFFFFFFFFFFLWWMGERERERERESGGWSFFFFFGGGCVDLVALCHDGCRGHLHPFSCLQSFSTASFIGEMTFFSFN